MHIHLPKALHGWHDFAKEVGIIVLGVLIALSAEQLVQVWHWHEVAKETRKALTNEIEYSALFSIERVAVQQCLRDRIVHLATKLNSGSPNWTADPMVLGHPRRPIGVPGIDPSVPLVYRTPHRPWLGDEWETAKSTGVLNHIDREDVRNFEFIYRSINELRSLQDQETSIIPELSYLSFRQNLQPRSRMQALATLSRLDEVNSLQGIMAQQILSSVRSHHVQFAPLSLISRTVTFDAAAKQILDALKDRYGICVVGVRLTS